MNINITSKIKEKLNQKKQEKLDLDRWIHDLDRGLQHNEITLNSEKYEQFKKRVGYYKRHPEEKDFAAKQKKLYTEIQQKRLEHGKN